MVAALAGMRLVVPVEDVGAAGGMAAPLAYQLSQRPGRPPAVRPRTLPDGFLPHGSRDELLTEFGLTPSALADHVRAHLQGG
jgi:1-deoxy-D-xylulose-5-phosphate synthase